MEDFGFRSAGTGNISGTTGKLAKFTTGNSIGDSVVEESSSNIGVGVTPTAKLHVNGSLRFQGISEAVGHVLTSDANGNANWQAPTTYTPPGGFFLRITDPNGGSGISNAGDVSAFSGQKLFIGASVSGTNYDDFSGWNSVTGLFKVPETTQYDLSGMFYHQQDWTGATFGNTYVTLAVVNVTRTVVICANTTYVFGQQELDISCAMNGVPLILNDEIGLYIVNNSSITLASDVTNSMEAGLSVQKRR